MTGDQLNGRTTVPVADPNAGFSAAIDHAIENLRRAVDTARENGAGISAVQDRAVRSILTP